MSAGNVHLKASLFLAAGFSVGALMAQDPGMLQCVGGALVGTIITPDLDVNKAYIGDKIIEKRIGWFGRRIWEWFWKPYKTSFKHGQFASHFPFWSTAVRLAYIYFWTILPFYTVYFLILRSVNYNIDLMYELVYWGRMFASPLFVYGLVSSDLIHFALDKMTKETIQRS